jgi:hypothetical protein
MRSKGSNTNSYVSWVLSVFGLIVGVSLLLGFAPKAQAALIFESVRVQFFTRDDDKDPEDTVQMWIEQGGARVSEVVTVSGGEKWDDNTAQRPIYIRFLNGGFYDSQTLRMMGQKMPTDKGWNFTVAAYGLAAFRQPTLVLPMGEKTRFKNRHQHKYFQFR